MVAGPNPLLTREEYLAFERRSETKHEYVAGEVFAMAGATRRPNRIQSDTLTSLNTQLRDRPCEVFPSDMRVTISALGIYTYPDITVVCGEPLVEDEEEDTLLNPTVIIEIFSPATEHYDRSRKFHRYQLIPSFHEYLLIAQDTRRIDHYVRQSDSRWFLTTYEHPDDVIVLPSIDCALALADAYRRVTFPSPALDGTSPPNQNAHRNRLPCDGSAQSAEADFVAAPLAPGFNPGISRLSTGRPPIPHPTPAQRPATGRHPTRSVVQSSLRTCVRTDR